MVPSPDRSTPESSVPTQDLREREMLSGVRESRAERTGLDTAELLQGVRLGSTEAFDELAREHSPRLYRMALHLSGRPEEAEDLVQETLVRALPALRNFEGRAQLSTYLVRALTNVWKNRLRSRSRSRIVDWFRGAGKGRDGEDQPGFDPADCSPTAHERLEAEDTAARVRAAVTRLDPDRRATLLLREVEELSYEEIASITRVPVGTVRSRLARARMDLRRLLGGRV